MQSRTRTEAPDTRVVKFADLSDQNDASAPQAQKEAAAAQKKIEKEARQKPRQKTGFWRVKKVPSRAQRKSDTLDALNGERAAQSQQISFFDKLRAWRCCVSAQSKDDFSSPSVRTSPKHEKESQDDPASCDERGGVVRQHTDPDATEDEFSRTLPSVDSNSLFTWMFVFKLPSEIDWREQTWFSWKLWWWHRYAANASNIVNCAFKFAKNAEVKEAIEVAPLPFPNPCERDVADSAARLLKPLLSSTDICCHSAAQYVAENMKKRNRQRNQRSYCRAEQCTIELFNGFLEFLNDSMKEVFKSYDSLVEKDKVANGHVRPANAVKHKYFTSNDHKKIFFCIRCEKEIVESFADAKEYPLQLDEVALRDKLHLKDLPVKRKALPDGIEVGDEVILLHDEQHRNGTRVSKGSLGIVNGPTKDERVAVSFRGTCTLKLAPESFAKQARKIRIHGASGPHKDLINGYYSLQAKPYNGKPCWQRDGRKGDAHGYLLWLPQQGWWVTWWVNNSKATSGWLHSFDEQDACLPTLVTRWKVQTDSKWEVQAVSVEKADETTISCACAACCLWLLKRDEAHSPAYIKYDTSNRQYFSKYSDQYREQETTVLQEIDRIRLVFDRITDDVNLHLLAAFGLVQDRFPLHNPGQLQKLREIWGNPSFGVFMTLTFTEPLHYIRRYFGEEIAFHFLFMQVLTRSLGILVPPALFFTLWERMYPKYSRLIRVLFTSVLMIWYRWLKKHWERTEAEYATAWGIDAHKYSGMKVLTNPRFRNYFSDVLVNMAEESTEANAQTGQIDICKQCGYEECECELQKDFKLRNVPIVDECKRFGGSVLSFTCTVFCILVLLVVVKIEIQWFLNLFRLQGSETIRILWFQVPEEKLLFSLLGVLTSIQIFVIDGVWSFLATYITDFEFIRDEYTYFRHKSVKLCIVRWINMSVSMIYTAFVLPLYAPDKCKRTAEADDEQVCMRYFREVLPVQFVMILLTRFLLLLLVNNLVIPALKERYVLPWKYPGLGEVEKQALMKKYSGTEIDEDFLHILIPVCFYVLFGIMMPEVVILLFIVCVAQKRITARKLVFYYQRPYPHLARSINFHNLVLGFFGYCMIACNLALISIHYGDVALSAKKEFLNILPQFSVAKTTFHWSFAGFSVFLVAVLILVTLWRLVDVFVPTVSSKLSSEIHLHALQIYKVCYRADVMKDVRIEPSLEVATAQGDKKELQRQDFGKARNWSAYTFRTESSTWVTDSEAMQSKREASYATAIEEMPSV